MKAPLILLLALAGDFPANGQDNADAGPPPAVTPAAKQQPATAPPTPSVTLRLPSTQPSAQSPPTQAEEQGPTARVVGIYRHEHVWVAPELAPVPAPQPVVQPITMTVAPSAQQVPVAAAAPTVVNAKVHRPWLLRRAVGQVGESLALLGRDRIYLPRQEPQTATVALTAPVQQVIYVTPAPTQAVYAQPQAQAIYATPQAPAKSR